MRQIPKGQIISTLIIRKNKNIILNLLLIFTVNCKKYNFLFGKNKLVILFSARQVLLYIYTWYLLCYGMISCFGLMVFNQQYFSYIVAVNFIGGGNYRPFASHWQTLSHNVVQLALSWSRTHNISGDGHRLHRSLYIQLPYDHGHDSTLIIQTIQST